MGRLDQPERNAPTADSVVVTARRLFDRVLVFRTGDGRWTTDLQEAAIATTPGAARTLLVAATGRNSGAADAQLAPIQLHSDGRRSLGIAPGTADFPLPHFEAVR